MGRYNSLKFAQVRCSSLTFAKDTKGSAKFFGIRNGPLKFAELLSSSEIKVSGEVLLNCRKVMKKLPQASQRF